MRRQSGAGMVTFVIPTRNRPDHLATTLRRLGDLPLDETTGEVIVVDNASSPAAVAPVSLLNRMPVRLIRLGRNLGAAGRNNAAHQARGAWLVMLDDDSSPLDCGFVDVLAEAPAHVAAIGAEIVLPSGKHEAGGLPEVVIGCGAAIRRDVFLRCGGYDARFGYYVEEYDLCARLLLMGHSVVHDRRFRVEHRKTSSGRNMNVILRRLVRNNCWAHQRYAPEDVRRKRLNETISRYWEIAKKEHAQAGYALGLAQALATLKLQQRTPMGEALFERFTGLAEAREIIGRNRHVHQDARIAIVARGKHDWCVEKILLERGARVVDLAHADALAIGTMSPGPVLDALAEWAGDGRPVIAPLEWSGIAQGESGGAATIAA